MDLDGKINVIIGTVSFPSGRYRPYTEWWLLSDQMEFPNAVLSYRNIELPGQSILLWTYGYLSLPNGLLLEGFDYLCLLKKSRQFQTLSVRPQKYPHAWVQEIQQCCNCLLCKSSLTNRIYCSIILDYNFLWYYRSKHLINIFLLFPNQDRTDSCYNLILLHIYGVP